MFSDSNETIVNYHKGSRYHLASFQEPLTLENRKAKNLLLSSYMLVRSNCEDACANKILADISDENKTAYRENSKIAQISLRSIKDSLSLNLDSCIRRCFGINLYLYNFSSKINWILWQ